MKTKIIHLISSIQLGGVEKGINLSVKTLNDTFDYRILTFSNNNTFIGDRVKEYFINSQNNFKIVNYIKSLIYLTKYKPDIVIASLWKSVPLALFYRKLINRKAILIGFVHSETFFHFADKFFIQIILNQADAIACDSNNTLEIVKERSKNAKKYFVIPYIFFGNTNKEIVLQKGKPLKFLFAGRIIDIKNLDLTIEFLELLHLNNINFLFDIYGIADEVYLQKLQALIYSKQLKDKVHFKESFNADQTSEVYSQHQFYIQFSKTEGMAMSVVDAMMNGLVPICTAVGEIKNYVEHNKNGFLIKPNSTKEDLQVLLKELLVIINNPELFSKMSVFNKQYFRNKKDYISAFTEMITTII